MQFQSYERFKTLGKPLKNAGGRIQFQYVSRLEDVKSQDKDPSTLLEI
jgi:hypothetical protein